MSNTEIDHIDTIVTHALAWEDSLMKRNRV